jgi:hypothetical protein
MMRPYTREEFESRLQSELGLSATDRCTKTARAWKTPKGNYVLVPQFDQPHRRYFDFHFSAIAHAVALIDSQNPGGAAASSSKVVPMAAGIPKTKQ